MTVTTSLPTTTSDSTATGAAAAGAAAAAVAETMFDTDVDTGLLDSHLPLVSRAALDARIRQLVPCAVQRQLWLILLDHDQVQLPVMIPIGDLPLRCRTADGEGLVELLASLTREFGVSAFVFIMERPGPSSPDETDRLWLRFLLESAAEQSFSVRGAYLCHDEGLVGYDGSDVSDLLEGGGGEPVRDSADEPAPQA